MTEQRIDHAAEARKVATAIENDPYSDMASFVAEAQLHATLALAEQQRIANLMGLFSEYISEEILSADEWKALTEEIKEALGL